MNANAVERGSTLFLKITVVMIGIPVLALGLLGLPQIAGEAADYFPDYWVYPAVAAIYASAIPFYAALYQTFKLLTYIDAGQAFSERSVKALKVIKHCAAAVGILYVVCLPHFYLMAEFDDAPGLIIMGLVPIFASMAVAVFAAVLQKLLKTAIDIKSENDLTV